LIVSTFERYADFGVNKRNAESARLLLRVLQRFYIEKRRLEMPDNGSINESTTGTSTAGAATALSQTAQDYGQKISDVASQAKDYMSEKVSVVGEKIKDLQNADLGELAENAKEYARKKPGQALLISAGVGLLLGLIIRGRK
jgi:ElaB/YqjD/DUF883 family membrane-anchored ribosome-binding protein